MNQSNQSLDKTIDKINSVLDYNQYVQTLFDPVQTHSVVNVPIADVERVKQVLRDVANATRFRVVKSHANGSCIVCFKLK